MTGEGTSKRIDLTQTAAKVVARVTLAAVLSTGFITVMEAPRAWAQAAQPAGRSDSDIQSDVGYALSNSAALKGQPITAATVEGDVTISGNVHDASSKELAESLIYRVNGVRSVTNNLTVGDTAAAPADAQATDANAGQQQQDPNYDPAQQNMAPVSPQDQAQAPAQPAPNDQAAGEADPSQPAPPQQQYPSGRQPYNQPQYAQQPGVPQSPVTIPSGTLLQVRTSEPLDASHAKPGQIFQATVAADVYQGNVLAIPRGAVIAGTVVGTKNNQGDVVGRQGLSLELSSLNLSGQVYPLPTDTWSGQGPGKAGYTASNTIGGAAIGAIIGGIAGRGMGAAIGAGAGAALGAGASAATTGPRMYLPAEAVVNFHLAAPLTVTPVSPQEAQRLAGGAYPQVRPRGPYPYGAYPPPPPPPGYYYGYRYPVAYYPYYYYRY